MAYKLLGAAQERWRRFNGHVLVAGVTLKDGERLPDDEERRRTRGRRLIHLMSDSDEP